MPSPIRVNIYYLGLNAALFEWAESYDSKNWARLRACVAPTMRIDYRSFLDKLWEALPADEYVAMASDPHVLGDPLLKTQHFIGSSKWEKVSDTEAVGWHQLRVPHQRYTDETKTAVAVKGHAHGTNQHWYKKVDGKWKFAGLAVEIKWGEFDLDKVFASGRDTFGESEKEKMMDEAAVLTGIPGGAADPPTPESMDMEMKPAAAQETAAPGLEQASYPSVIGNTSGLRDLAESVRSPMVYEEQVKGGMVGAPMVYEEEIKGDMVAV
ncbi:MAG: hypothetical protein ASARMPREDX12_003331 [Alectoria sarmentosa]|nr:MAG: hypothetical protein ASARMPREDX12_003331 [Alectoria sarmentosa]